MKNTMIVVTDLTELKAYRLDNDSFHSTPRLELVDQFQTRANRKLVEETSDMAGRFPRATVAHEIMGGMSHGERHNIELEKRKRCTRRLAGRINSLLRDNKVERCFLAASREINNPLLQELDARVKTKIEIALAADLTKVNKSELLGHFRAATRARATM